MEIILMEITILIISYIVSNNNIIQINININRIDIIIITMDQQQEV